MRLLRSVVFLLLIVFPCAATLSAQQGQQARATRDAGVRAVPDGNVIATVQSGTIWRTGSARGGFTQVTLEGWIDATRLGARRDSFPATIGGRGTLRLRADASLSARILGVFEQGAGIRILERKGDWARVRRDGWVLSTALAATTASAPAAPNSPATTPATTRPNAGRANEPAATPGRADPSAEPVDPPQEVRDGALRATTVLPLSAAPGTKSIGLLEPGAVVDPIARDRGWVKVRIETWVPDSLLVPADSSYAGRLTAADLRLSPDAHKGQMVRWSVQVVSLQYADPLRRAMTPEEPYFLAMGPSRENAILYIAIPPELLDEAKRIAPMTEVNITGRIRNGRSQPTGAPVIDLLSISRK